MIKRFAPALFVCMPRSFALACSVSLLGCFADPPALELESTSSSADDSSTSVGDSVSDTSSAANATSSGDGGHDATGTSDATTRGLESEESDDSAGSDGGTEEGTTGPDVPGVIGPLVPLADIDDGAMHPDCSGYGAHWYVSGENNADGEQYLGEFPQSCRYYGYMRFTLDQAIPSGAIVDSAVLELSGYDQYAWNGDALRVWLQDSDDAAAVGGTFDYPIEGSAVELLRESLRWPAMGGLVWQQPGPNETPDLSSLVQALVDAHDGLAAGAHLQLWVSIDVVDGIGEEVGWLDSIAGEATAPRLTIAFHRG